MSGGAAGGGGQGRAPDGVHEGRLSWMYERRYLIYIIGLAVWVLQAPLGPSLNSHESELSLGIPWTIAFALLGLNCISVYLRRGKRADDTNPGLRHKEEAARIGAIQQYGGNLIVAASVIAAITSTSIKIEALTLLAASISTGIVAIVPIWMSQDDWRPINLLRHVKTVLLSLSVAWLVQAILVILVQGIP